MREGIVADADLVDGAMIFGTGFAPHRGGPISAIRERGRQQWLDVLAALEAKHGERFRADPGWS